MIVEAIQRNTPFFSFVIGMGVAVLLFHRNYSTIRTLGVPLEKTTDTIVKSDGKCYRYRVEDADCENMSNK
jgi:hypothetical protein